MAEWWSIEVFSGDRLPASQWRYTYEDTLTEAAVTHGALFWDWYDTQHGVLFEVCFATEEQWVAFRKLPSVRGALDAVPDPDGLLIYRGRGGAAGSRNPRKPKPAPSAAALELEEPREHRRFWLRKASARAAAIDELLRSGALEDEPGIFEEPGILQDPGQPARYGAA
jgi:hypothetical protein